MTGPETLHADLACGNPGTMARVRDSVDDSMTMLDSSADSLVLATSGVEWKGRDRAAYNERFWATKAMAEMAHLRCSQGKVALTSVRRAYVARIQSADRIIAAWRKIKTMKLAGPVLANRRQAAITALKAEHTMYTAVLVAATNYLPTDELAQQDGDAADFNKYLQTGGLSDDQRELLERGLGNTMHWDLDRGVLPGPVIPDTEVTGNDDGLVPQGVGFSPENGGTLIQVSYGGENDDTAVATIIDPDTGEVINTVVLEGWRDPRSAEQPLHHVGSVVIDGDDVWVTSGGDESRAVRYSLTELKSQNLGSRARSLGSADLKQGGHSFSTIHTESDGTTFLYAGHFGDDRMYRYEKVGHDWVRDDDYEVKTPEFTQGVVVTDGEMTFSTSFGNGMESEVKTFDRATLEDGGDAENETGLIDKDYLPNMSEGIVATPDGLIVMHESGANEYVKESGMFKGTPWVNPFMTVLQPEDVGVAGNGIEVETATLRQAARKLVAVEDDLSAAATSIQVTQLPTFSLGDVEGAEDFAEAFNLHLTSTAIWLRRSEISAGISIDGLLQSAEEHDRADTKLRSLWEWQREHGDPVKKGKELYEKADELTPGDGPIPLPDPGGLGEFARRFDPRSW